jgi:hypothetical protein
MQSTPLSRRIIILRDAEILSALLLKFRFAELILYAPLKGEEKER